VVDAEKTDTDNSENITTGTVTLTTEVSGFLLGTLYSTTTNNRLFNGSNELVLGTTGTVTLPQGGTITEGYVTSNPTIQLTPASPSVASQKLVIKGGGTFSTTENGITVTVPSNTWTEGNVDYVYVDAPTRGGQTLYWWIYPEDAGLSTPSTGTVVLDEFGEGNFTFTLTSDAYEFRVRVSPEEDNYDPANVGVQSVLINSGSPTFEGEHHLHLTTGDLAVTSIFLGTDDHNVRTTTDGKIQITTPNDVNNVWEFGTDGDLTIPGDIRSENAINIDINLSDSTLRRWRFGEDGDLTLPGNIVKAFEEDLIISTSYTAMISPPGPVSNSFTFGANGTLTIPGDIVSSYDITIRGGDNRTVSLENGAGGHIEIGYQSGSGNIYIGAGAQGTTTFLESDKIRIMANVPSSSKGASGDGIGLVAFNSNYIYYCTATYDGTTDIWKRVALTGGTW